ncbi:MAG: DUF4358 domain-containing protein [Clostridiales bacterium]|nr:DUF4358 domain-containing protein [Clostridiales bacterium]
MKKIFCLCLSLLLCAGILTGCTGGNVTDSPIIESPIIESPIIESPIIGSPRPTSDTTSPDELTQRYQNAIESARSQEDNEAVPLITNNDGTTSELVFDKLGVTVDDMTAYAIGISPTDTRAYGVAAIKPAVGRKTVVEEGVRKFVDDQKKGFENNMVDQYEIANSAKIETLEDDTVLLVMCEAQESVLTSIKDALNA